MKSLSGVRIFLAATAVSATLALSLILHHGASGAVIPPVPARSAEQITTPPDGFTNFQTRYPNEVHETAPAYATEDQVAMARATNTEINKQIIWRETQLWTVAPEGPSDGDCKTFALTKRHDLGLRGVPDGALRLAIVSVPRLQELHMILELLAVDGVYVLDSLRNDSGETFYKVAAMPESYTVLKYQAWGRPEHWLAPTALTAQHDEPAQNNSY
jgi:predicted transglutaminase-like cysteine proteinase